MEGTGERFAAQAGFREIKYVLLIYYEKTLTSQLQR